jgi:hypothetical protein
MCFKSGSWLANPWIGTERSSYQEHLHTLSKPPIQALGVNGLLFVVENCPGHTYLNILEPVFPNFKKF